MKAQITMRSGAQLTIDVAEINSLQNSATGRFVKFDWNTPKNATIGLVGIDPTEIAAIITIKEPGDDGECTCEQLFVGPQTGTITGRRNPKCPQHKEGE